MEWKLFSPWDSRRKFPCTIGEWVERLRTDLWWPKRSSKCMMCFDEGECTVHHTSRLRKSCEAMKDEWKVRPLASGAFRWRQLRFCSCEDWWRLSLIQTVWTRNTQKLLKRRLRARLRKFQTWSMAGIVLWKLFLRNVLHWNSIHSYH